MLNLSILMENSASSGQFACEHGLSFLLESDDAVILLDTGQSGALLDNADKMDCDLGKVTEIVLSHGHYDHTGGLPHALERIASRQGRKSLPPIICHPGVSGRRFREQPGSLEAEGTRDIGMPEASKKAMSLWSVRYVDTPYQIREDIIFLGEIPRIYPDLTAPVGLVPGGNGFVEDSIPDDSALAYKTPKGLIIMAGCSHSGIVNIVEHARRITGVEQVYAVFGGMHFMDMKPKVLDRTLEYIEELDIPYLFACHCSGSVLSGHPRQIQLAAGDKFSFDI